MDCPMDFLSKGHEVRSPYRGWTLIGLYTTPYEATILRVVFLYQVLGGQTCYGVSEWSFYCICFVQYRVWINYFL